MRLTVQKSAWHEAGVNHTYIKLASQACCAEMQAAWDDEFIGYGDHEEGDDRGNRNINIYRYDSDEEIWFARPISHCPFCGASIEIQHVN